MVRSSESGFSNYAGSVKKNVAPRSTSASAQMRPPCFSTMRWTLAGLLGNGFNVSRRLCAKFAKFVAKQGNESGDIAQRGTQIMRD